MNDNSQAWMDLLRELFGDDAEEARRQLQELGLDPEVIATAAGVTGTPGMMDHLLDHIRSLLTASAGTEVNWALAHDVARGVAAQGGDPVVSSAQATSAREAVSRAELWLDAATAFDPATEPAHVWSRAQWVEATLPTWQMIAGPVMSSVSRALTSVITKELSEDGVDAGLTSSIAPTVCGMHMGQAAGQMARDTFGVTDLGLPLLTPVSVALIPSSIERFADGLDVDPDEVATFIAMREAAHVRLLRSVPWLTHHLHSAVERFAASIRIDLDVIDEAVAQADPSRPDQLQEALTRGIFTPGHDEAQAATIETIETTIALIEGWVEVVTARAAAPHLKAFPSLQEMMRRRRAAGGPAEDTFAMLLGMELRPRRMRQAAQVWATLTARGGHELRDRVWSHPDAMPTTSDLDNPDAWIDRALGQGEPDEVDREIERLLSSDD